MDPRFARCPRPSLRIGASTSRTTSLPNQFEPTAGARRTRSLLVAPRTWATSSPNRLQSKESSRA